MMAGTRVRGGTCDHSLSRVPLRPWETLPLVEPESNGGDEQKKERIFPPNTVGAAVRSEWGQF